LQLIYYLLFIYYYKSTHNQYSFKYTTFTSTLTHTGQTYKADKSAKWNSQSATNLKSSLTTPTTQLLPSCNGSCHSLGSTSCEERGDLLHGQQSILHSTLPTLCSSTGEDTPASSQDVVTTREGTVTGSKLIRLAKETSARGPFRRWERSSRLIGQLPPVSSWAAPSQLGAVSPWLICHTGCVGSRGSSRKVGHKTLHQAKQARKHTRSLQRCV
jgi:hypothetical protein